MCHADTTETVVFAHASCNYLKIQILIVYCHIVITMISYKFR